MADNLAPKVQWFLTDEGMGVLERAGLAGLYLSLTAAEKWAAQGDSQAQELQRILSWELSDQSVKLWWAGEDLPALAKLVEWAWQIKEGVYYLPGLHRDLDTREHHFLRIPTHSGIVATFLQYTGQLRPALEDQTSILVPLDVSDPTKTLSIRYRPIKQGQTVRQIRVLKEIDPLTRQGDYREISLAGWIHPGSAPRYDTDAAWTATTEKALLLLFAPIACFYMKLPKTKAKKRMRENWAFVVPEITSLNDILSRYGEMQVSLQNRFDDIQVQGLEDAGFRFAVAYAGRALQRKFSVTEINVVAMGVTDYYSAMPTVTTKIRKKILRLNPTDISINRYRILMKIMSNVFEPRKLKEEERTDDNSEITPTHWIRQPTARGRIAENLVNNLPWYRELAWPPAWQVDEVEDQRKRLKDNISTERLWFSNLQKRDWRALMDLVKEQAMWDSLEEQAFFAIYHQTLRNVLTREVEGLSRGGARDLRERWENRVEKIRRDLMRAKTLDSNRKTIVEFLAGGGGSKELTEKKEAIWGFLNHPYDWKKARDLALLALVTFTDKRLAKSEGKEEGKAHE